MRTDEQVARDAIYYATRGFKRVRIGDETRHVLLVWVQSSCPEHTDDGCVIYRSRPQTCQDFPIVPLNIVGSPCSYWFEDDRGFKAGGSGSPHNVSAEELLDYESR